MVAESRRSPILSAACGLGLLAAAHGVSAAGARSADVPYRISGKGWAEGGAIVHSTDTLYVNLNRNVMQTAGAQFTAYADITENLEGAFGIGGFQGHNIPGDDVHAKLMKFFFRNFITEARITWFQGEKADPKHSLTFGNFDFNYNPDVKNLGLYLLRGSVYPGFLISGFLDPAVDDTRGDILGLKAHAVHGRFSQTLVFANERSLPPSFDWSLGYVAKLKPFDGLTLGAGVNFHRILSANEDLTTPSVPGYYEEDSLLVARGGGNRYDVKFTEGRIDTVKDASGNPILDGSGNARLKYVPTVEYTHRGIKAVGLITFDPKAAFGIGGSLGPEDLKIYAEAAVIGIKNYGKVYDKVSERIPMVLGVNLPTFGLLDVMSLEVEHYGSRYRNDIAKLGPTSKYSILPSPVPVSYQTYEPMFKGVDSASGRLIVGETLDSAGVSRPVLGPQVRGTALDIQDLTQDDWKWSLFLQKTVRGHIRFTGQVANDHFRPEKQRGVNYNEIGGTSEASSSLSDWYFMFRIGYFF